MRSDIDIWLEEMAERVLKELGIRKSQTVLDFGCGSGHYTIPAARIVGEKGRVYALDKSRISLIEVAKRSKSEKLKNIHMINISGELKIPLEDESIDVTLLYDVIHSHYFSATGRRELLSEIYRISKPNALISVYPKHIDLENIKHEIEKGNFHFTEKLFKTLLHNRSLTQDYLLNFQRR
jgi:ubiquinone/menaquinone biosynthesis C-methylase UbiE